MRLLTSIGRKPVDNLQRWPLTIWVASYFYSFWSFKAHGLLPCEQNSSKQFWKTANNSREDRSRQWRTLPADEISNVRHFRYNLVRFICRPPFSERYSTVQFSLIAARSILLVVAAETCRTCDQTSNCFDDPKTVFDVRHLAVHFCWAKYIRFQHQFRGTCR